MKRLAVTAALALVLASCGDAEPDVADDPGPGVEATPSASPSPTPSATPSATPSSMPTDGPYPDYPPTDYEFLLAVSCFCPDAGTPIAITVAGDEVVDAVLAADGTGRGGGKKGDPAADYLWHTIDDIIDEANAAEASEAAVVTVTWSTGEEPPYPTSVFIDQSAEMADEEIGYTISSVVVG